MPRRCLARIPIMRFRSKIFRFSNDLTPQKQRIKNLACEILRLRRVAFATNFPSDAVRSPEGIYVIGNEVSYKK